ncbi:hypothetical protein R8Z50_22805 [Longispora sp. K20-0274]|uniref:hypothetical protein n=1 Tax=Longispora sp. K20-0274 TaxID=3088255 RepID=UPI00399B886E
MQPHDDTSPTQPKTWWFLLTDVLPLARQAIAMTRHPDGDRLVALHLFRQGGAVYLVTTAPGDSDANPYGIQHAEALVPPAERSNLGRYQSSEAEVYGDVVLNDGTTGRCVFAQLITATHRGHDALRVTMTGTRITAVTSTLPDGW